MEGGQRGRGTEASGSPYPQAAREAHPKPARRPLSHSPALHQETTGACLPAGWLAENDNELEMRSLESSEQDPKRFSTHVRNHLVQQMLWTPWRRLPSLLHYSLMPSADGSFHRTGGPCPAVTEGVLREGRVQDPGFAAVGTQRGWGLDLPDCQGCDLFYFFPF